MISDTALKPCPFCGGRASFKSTQVGEDAVASWIACDNCFATTDQTEDAYSSPDIVAGWWNTRVTP